MSAHRGMLVVINRLAPGVLPPPATAAARALAPKRPPLLWHTCASHPKTGRGCHPGCVMLCGARWRADSRERRVLEVSADRCVVCAEMAGRS